MNQPASKLQGMSHMLFDAFPAPAVVVDAKLRIQEFNPAAAVYLGGRRSWLLQRRIGNALHCVHAKQAPDGCGTSLHCPECALHRAAQDAAQDRNAVRRPWRMDLRPQGGRRRFDVVISATPIVLGGRRLALLFLETAETPAGPAGEHHRGATRFRTS